MSWVLLVAVALLAAGGILVLRSTRLQDLEIAELRAQLGTVRKTAADAAEDARRAFVISDNQRLQLDAMAREIGWTDSRARTKVLTDKFPKP